VEISEFHGRRVGYCGDRGAIELWSVQLWCVQLLIVELWSIEVR
jgi:hypothetical protein